MAAKEPVGTPLPDLLKQLIYSLLRGDCWLGWSVRLDPKCKARLMWFEYLDWSVVLFEISLSDEPDAVVTVEALCLKRGMAETSCT